METRAHYVAVGAFVLAMVTLAFVAVLWLARSELTSERAMYEIYFKGPVSGLRIGAPVEYAGVPAGKVADIRIDPNNVEQIRVTVEIDAGIAIKTDAVASVETNILSGVSYIQIVGGTKDAPLLMPQPGQRYAVIRAHRSRLASVTARAPQLLDRLIETTDSLNEVLSEKNRVALAESLENLRIFTGGLADRRQDIAEFTATANEAARGLMRLIDNVDKSYAGNDGIGNRLAGAINDFDKVARNLSETNKQLQSAVQDVRPGLRSFSQQTLSDIGSLVTEARRLVAGLSRLAAEIERDPSQVLFGDRREGYRPR
jgi:phospholipid/cholesterol/gamma-HCH transport system substrate-binding protein